MNERYEIRIAGSGGQGVILAAVILGEAAALYEEGLNVVQAQAYGPEARGGASKSEVVISREPIDYPKAVSPKLQVVLTQAACDKYAADTAADGILILDDFYVTKLPDIKVKTLHLPIVRTARDAIGREVVANMVALGVIGKVLEQWGLLHPESVKKALLARVPKGTEELNERAFEAGYALL